MAADRIVFAIRDGLAGTPVYAGFMRRFADRARQT
jgi:hypothetical protein